MVRVLGIDLSLTSTGLVSLPGDWVSEAGLDWSGVRFHRLGQGLRKSAAERERVGRLEVLSKGIVDVARAWEVSHVVLEEYAFSAQPAQARAVAELGGVVKWRLQQIGLSLRVVSPASARKTLLGKLPRKDAKLAVQLRCAQLGVPWKDVKVSHGYGDICDAFVVANHHLAELVPGCCVMEAA